MCGEDHLERCFNPSCIEESTPAPIKVQSLSGVEVGWASDWAQERI